MRKSAKLKLGGMGAGPKRTRRRKGLGAGMSALAGPLSAVEMPTSPKGRKKKKG